MSVSLPFTTSLDQSAERIVAALKSLINAASKDDVQAGAILAVERLGATLAISPESRRKIEQLIDERADNIVVEFLKARVGYTAGQSLNVLRQSVAGVNFLALAAALLGSIEDFEVAVSCESMITNILSSSNDSLPIPTAYQLKKLLEVLEPTLIRLKFLEEVNHWRTWLEQCIQRTRTGPAAAPLHHLQLFAPNAEGIAHLVHAFRRVSRIIDADMVRIEVSICYASWIMAFTVWSLGAPPKVLLDGISMPQESPSPVVIVLQDPEEFDDDLEVKIFRTHDDFSEILHSANTRTKKKVVGMVSLKTFAEYNIMHRGFMRGDGKIESLEYRAMMQTLPAALYQVRELCWQKEGLLIPPNKIVNPFPTTRVLARISQEYLGLSEPLQIQKPEAGWHVIDAPLVRSLSKPQCDPEDDCEFFDLTETFVSRLAILVADILALSLFGTSLDDMMLWHMDTRVLTLSSNGTFGSIVREILETGKPKQASVVDILQYALSLVHHDAFDNLRNDGWNGSSMRGQVVFPKVYEHCMIGQDGFLELYCLPGVLMSEDLKKTYKYIVSPAVTLTTSSQMPNPHELPVTCVENHFEGQSIVWNTGDAINGLVVAVGLAGGDGMLNPFDTLINLGKSVLSDTCDHGRYNTSSHHETDAYYLGPTDREPESYCADRKIAVSAIDGNNKLRLLALSLIRWRPISDDTDPLVLIARRACITCALAQCRRLGCLYLVL